MKIGVKWAAFLAVAMPMQAAAADQCLSRQAAQNVGVAMLPALMEQGIAQCRKYLPDNAALLTLGPAATARYRQDAAAVRTQAGVTLKKLAGDMVPASMPASLVLPFAEAMLVDMMAGELDAESCKMANNGWSPLADLPAKNLADIAVAFIAGKQASKAENEPGENGEQPESDPLSDFAICPFVATATAA